jgi:hypothetical protein
MPFDPNDPNAWIDEITANDPPFLRSICKSLYHEPTLVRWPAHAILCKWGMTSDGRIGLVEDEIGFNLGAPPPRDRMLRQDDERYRSLVRQEDPDALNPGPANSWAFGVAAFKRCGGNVPVAVPGTEGWRLFHLYEPLTHLVIGNPDESERAGRHFAQGAAWVALHPVICHLKGQYPCIESTLRAKAFGTFNYDPLAQFAPRKEHDNCGFVIRG